VAADRSFTLAGPRRPAPARAAPAAPRARIVIAPLSFQRLRTLRNGAAARARGARSADGVRIGVALVAPRPRLMASRWALRGVARLTSLPLAVIRIAAPARVVAARVIAARVIAARVIAARVMAFRPRRSRDRVPASSLASSRSGLAARVIAFRPRARNIVVALTARGAGSRATRAFIASRRRARPSRLGLSTPCAVRSPRRGGANVGRA
jgi:hypothetical protein